MKKKPNASWHYYQWDPTAFKLDNRIRKLDGPDIAFLRLLQDVIWMTGEQRILYDVCLIARETDFPVLQAEETIERLVRSKALYESEGFLRSPHIDDCWGHCQYRSDQARKARQQGVEKQKESNVR